MRKTIWCTNGEDELRVETEDDIPFGFHRGRKKKSVEEIKVSTDKRLKTMSMKSEEELLLIKKKISENSFLVNQMKKKRE